MRHNQPIEWIPRPAHFHGCCKPAIGWWIVDHPSIVVREIADRRLTTEAYGCPRTSPLHSVPSGADHLCGRSDGTPWPLRGSSLALRGHQDR